MMGRQLDGKTAIITGSTSGIGRATAMLFAQEGASVVVTGRREELGNEVVQQIVDQGDKAIYVPTDVGVAEDLQGMVQAAVDAYGRVDILVNNAISFGPGSFGSVLEMTAEGFDVIVHTSLTAIILGSKYAIPEMIKVGGGSIINMSSVHGVLAGHYTDSYNTVKAGMLNLTRAMAMDFGRHNIRVNAICPGCILTEREIEMQTNEQAAWFFRYKKLAIPEVYPLRRAGQPEEVAKACLFLASDLSSFVTGATLMVDGGLTVQNQEALIVPLGDLFRKTFAEEWGIDLSSEAGNIRESR
jgi:NAD(P)-dependent dehydrogenase (short-subunit alcohol dehydrogenase family)